MIISRYCIYDIAFMISFPFIVSNYTWANYSNDLGKANMHEIPAMHSDE